METTPETVCHTRTTDNNRALTDISQGLNGTTGTDPPLGSVNDGGSRENISPVLGPTMSEESWVAAITRVRDGPDSPVDTCWEYLNQKGLIQGGSEEEPRLSADCAPLRGKRWYLCLNIAGHDVNSWWIRVLHTLLSAGIPCLVWASSLKFRP